MVKNIEINLIKCAICFILLSPSYTFLAKKFRFVKTDDCIFPRLYTVNSVFQGKNIDDIQADGTVFTTKDDKDEYKKELFAAGLGHKPK